jgi:fructose-1,6-bisphosphatase/inositol monophosphatase family enzyme
MEQNTGGHPSPEVVAGWMVDAQEILMRPHTPDIEAGGAKNAQGDSLSRRDVEVQTLFFKRTCEKYPRIIFIGEEELNLEGCSTKFPKTIADAIFVVVDPTDGSNNWILNQGGQYATTLALQKGRVPFFAIINLPLQKRIICVGDGDVLENGKQFTAKFKDFIPGELSIAYGTGKKMGKKARDAFVKNILGLEKKVEIRRPSCLTASVFAVADGKVHAYVSGKERATNSNALLLLAERLGMEFKFYRSGPNLNEDQRMIFARPGFIDEYVPEDGWLKGFLSQDVYNEGDY